MVPDCTVGKKPWRLISVPLTTPTLNQLREKFSELTRAEPHLGLNPGCPSLEDPSITLEAERYALGLKVLSANHAPLSQEFLKKGCPHSLRGKIWAQVLGCDATDKDMSYHKTLIQAVIHNDVMVDKLIIKDVQVLFFCLSRCLKITEKVSFNIASEASYVYILIGQMLIKNVKNGPFWRVFENLKLAVNQCYQTGHFDRKIGRKCQN